MVGAYVLRHSAGVMQFTEVLFFKPDRKSFNRFA
jgi:hypothetical protein